MAEWTFRTKNQFLNITFAHYLNTAWKESNAILNLKVRTISAWHREPLVSSGFIISFLRWSDHYLDPWKRCYVPAISTNASKTVQDWEVEMKNTTAMAIPKTTCASAGDTASWTFLWKLWLCSFVRLTVSSPHALHTNAGRRPKRDHTCVWSPMPKRMIDRTHADPYRDDNRLSEIAEPSSVAWVPLALLMDDFNHAQIRRKEYLPT